MQNTALMYSTELKSKNVNISNFSHDERKDFDRIISLERRLVFLDLSEDTDENLNEIESIKTKINLLKKDFELKLKQKSNTTEEVIETIEAEAIPAKNNSNNGLIAFVFGTVILGTLFALSGLKQNQND